MKKKLLIVTNRFVVGGPAIHTAMLAEYLQSDYEIKLIGGLGIKGEVTNLDIFKNIDSEPIIIDEFSRSFNILRIIKHIKKSINSLNLLNQISFTLTPQSLA